MLHGYAYSAYGETVPLGPDGGNPLQYTGRENDGTGLYYYRARYYDPVLKQFISEDPVGPAAGTNLVAYVNGDPISYNDPFGLFRPTPPGLNPPSQSSRIGTWLQRLLGPTGEEAGIGAELSGEMKSGATGASAGVAIGNKLCSTGVSNQGLWSDCTQECLMKMNAGSGGSDQLIECTNACIAAYKQCKKQGLPQSACPVPPML